MLYSIQLNLHKKPVTEKSTYGIVSKRAVIGEKR